MNPYTGFNPDAVSRAKELRRDMTKYEKHLWYDFLRTYPVKFYRQRPIDNYIADFYCSDAKLVVEVDGIQHTLKVNVEYDNRRTAVLEKYGLKVIRFTNDEVDNCFQDVCYVIDKEVRERIAQ